MFPYSSLPLSLTCMPFLKYSRNGLPTLFLGFPKDTLSMNSHAIIIIYTSDTTRRRRGGRCGAGWKGGSRNPPPAALCRRRLLAHRRAASVPTLCVPRSRSRLVALRREPAPLEGFARSRADFRGCCCRCYTPCRAVSAARPHRFASQEHAASLAPRPPRCRQHT